MFDFSAEIQIKRWPTVKELEMSAIPWFTVGEEIQRLGKMGMLEWICAVKSNLPHWDDPSNVPFSDILRNRFTRGTPASLKCPAIVLICMPDLVVGTIFI